MAFDPTSINVVPSAEMISQLVMWLSYLLWALIICVLAFFFVSYMRFRIPAEIFEQRGNAIVKTRNTKLREIIKDNVTKYEVRTLMGLISRKRRQYYYNTNEEYKIPTTRGFKFYLLRMSFNAYNPLRINIYLNEIDKIKEELLNPTLEKKEKKELTKKEKEFRDFMKHDEEVKESRYTYVPISMPDTTTIEFEPIPQNLLPVLARSVVETNQMYSQQKWWEPYLFPLSIFALCIIQVIVMGWMFEKVGQVGGACQEAKSSILDVAKQRLT